MHIQTFKEGKSPTPSRVDHTMSPSFFTSSFYESGQKAQNRFFQTKLSVGKPGDKYEKEADAVAQKVVSGKENPSIQQKTFSKIQKQDIPKEEEKNNIQRKCAGCEKEEKEKVQTKSEGNATQAPSSMASQLQDSKGRGSNLSATTLSEMNHSFGRDFSNVKIHNDQDAVNMNKSLNAQAFTTGNDIYFNSNKFNPGTTKGKELLAHELTHVVQQTGAQSQNHLQRSCNDGACDSCFGGTRDFWITFFFRRRATARTMRYLRQQINEAKRILANCCLRLKANFNWKLLGGGGTFNFLQNNADGSWQYSNDAATLGTGNTFNGSRGIPVLVVDDVPNSGGGVTVDTRFDTNYTGRTYAVVGVNQTNPNPGCNHLAHELWHVSSGIVGHDVAHGTLAACSGNDVSPEYCSGLRNIVAPVGDFPIPSGDTAVA